MGYEKNKLISLNYGFVLSNKYLEVIIQFLKPKILNKKAEVLLYKIKYAESNLNFLIKCLRF